MEVRGVVSLNPCVRASVALINVLVRRTWLPVLLWRTRQNCTELLLVAAFTAASTDARPAVLLLAGEVVEGSLTISSRWVLVKPELTTGVGFACLLFLGAGGAAGLLRAAAHVAFGGLGP